MEPDSISKIPKLQNLKKVNKKSEGLGDSIAKLTCFFMIDKLVDWFSSLFGKEDCGCDRRRQLLNEKVPYKKRKT